MSVVTVSASTHAIRPGQISAASVSVTRWVATFMPWTICPTGPNSGGAGCARTAVDPVNVVATDPSGSAETTTIGVAPPAQALSTARRATLRPAASTTAPSGRANRITAATVTRGCYPENTRP